jgi:hypothetical protein
MTAAPTTRNSAAMGRTWRRRFGGLPFLAVIALALAGSPASAATGPVREVCKNHAGSVQQLAEILNTRDSGVQCLGLALSDGKVTALRIETHRFAKTGKRVADPVQIAEFPVTEIESRHGAVLAGESGHDAVILQGRISSALGTADLVTRYLYNGLTGEYRSCAVRLDRGPDTVWRLLNRFNEQVSRIVVKTRSLPAFGVFGIADLEGACTPTTQ